MGEKSLLNKIQSTSAVFSISLLRIVLGLIFFKEGAGKLLGWFGGSGVDSVAAFFQKLGIIFPQYSAFLVSYTEFLGGIALVFGFLVRPAAVLIAGVMAVAIFTAHRQSGYHYPLLILLVCMVFLQAGAGKFSLDHLMSKVIKK